MACRFTMGVDYSDPFGADEKVLTGVELAIPPPFSIEVHACAHVHLYLCICTRASTHMHTFTYARAHPDA